MKRVGMMPLGKVNEHLLAFACSAIGKILAVSTIVREPLVDIQEFYDVRRGQYNAREILLRMKTLIPPPDGLTVAVCEVDLFSPIFTFVFGEAEFKGNVAVASSYRLSPEIYGLPPDRTLLHERTSKELIHEIGHTYGLRHCSELSCVMHTSTYAEEIDLKKITFCKSCSSLIHLHVA
ncbi:MAG TPA: archaemetzincin family Zn-dependent metalloprotease [Bacteroidota bacterium]